MASSDTEVELSASSVSDALSTPELLTPTSSSDDSSYLSARSQLESFANDSEVKIVQGSLSSSPVEVDFPSLAFPPERNGKIFRNITYPSIRRHRPLSLPIVSSFSSDTRPHKLRKSRPSRSIDPSQTHQISHSTYPSDKGPSVSKLARRRTAIITTATEKVVRSRRSSLPVIASSPLLSEATFAKFYSEQHKDRTVRFCSSIRSPHRRSHGFPSPYPHHLSLNTGIALLALAGASASIDASLCGRYESMNADFVLPSPESEIESSSSDSHSDVMPSQSTSAPTHHHILWNGPLTWRTLAMAITDESVSDEALLEELENARIKERMWQWETRQTPLTPFSPTMPSARSVLDGDRVVTSSSSEDEEREEDNSQGNRLCFQISDGQNKPCSSRSRGETWATARNALLTCREIIRTERRYVEALRSLLSGQTATPPPSLMLTYIPALIESSEVFLAKMEDNPSALGIASAFLLLEKNIENALVSWCGVAGSFFVDSPTKSSRSSSMGSDGDVVLGASNSLKRRVGSWGKRINSMRLSANSSANSSTASLADSKDSHHIVSVVRGRQPPTPRELAILPTQRVMRYALLFKDLYSHTIPGSTSQKVVQDAMLASLSVAQKCDHAQGNAAFLF